MLTINDILFTQGNHKLPKTTAIINITSAHDCPAKQHKMCPIPFNLCYALKAERSYRPEVLPYRRCQAKIWPLASPELIAEAIMAKSFRCTINRITLLRFSESGDFRNQYDVDKMSRIAYILNYAKIKVYGYTARSDLNFSRVDDNMIVNGSNTMIHNKYTAIPKKELKGHKFICPGNCRICSICSERAGRTIYAGIH